MEFEESKGGVDKAGYVTHEEILKPRPDSPKDMALEANVYFVNLVPLVGEAVSQAVLATAPHDKRLIEFRKKSGNWPAFIQISTVDRRVSILKFNVNSIETLSNDAARGSISLETDIVSIVVKNGKPSQLQKLVSAIKFAERLELLRMMKKTAENQDTNVLKKDQSFQILREILKPRPDSPKDNMALVVNVYFVNLVGEAVSQAVLATAPHNKRLIEFRKKSGNCPAFIKISTVDRRVSILKFNVNRIVTVSKNTARGSVSIETNIVSILIKNGKWTEVQKLVSAIELAKRLELLHWKKKETAKKSDVILKKDQSGSETVIPMVIEDADFKIRLMQEIKDDYPYAGPTSFPTTSEGIAKGKGLHSRFFCKIKSENSKLKREFAFS